MINALSEAPEGVHHRPCAQFLQKEAFLNPTSVILHRRDIFSARQPTMLASLINPGSIPRRSETLNFLHPSPFLKRSRTGSICMSSAAATGSENVPELGRSAGNCAQWSKSRLQRGAFYVGRQARASLSGSHGGGKI